MPVGPNILFITADSLGARDLGCYGSRVGSTPTLDSFAKRSVRYDRCYATHPVCAPNRGTMLTGRSCVVHGVTTNNQELQPDTPTYAHLLKDHGYRTAVFGKLHQTTMALDFPASWEYLGFDEAVVTDDTRLGPWIDWIEREHPEEYRNALSTCWPMPCLEQYGPEQRDLRTAWREARTTIMDPLRNASTWNMVYTSPVPAELDQTTFIADCADAFLRRHRSTQQPFMCHVSFVGPHDPFDPPRPYDTMFHEADMQPAIEPAWREGDCKAYQRQRQWHRFGELWSQPFCRRMRAMFHGKLRHIDDQIARLLKTLEQTGLADNTIVVFTTDHGDALGDHGLNTKGNVPFDRSIRCPLLVHIPGQQPGISNRLTCTLDFMPSFLQWAGIEPSLWPPLEGRTLHDEGWLSVSVTIGEHLTIIGDDHWRLTRFTGEPYAELVDLDDGTYERLNHYHDPGQSDRRQAMLEQLCNHLARPAQVVHYRTYPHDNAGNRLANGEAFAIRPVGFQLKPQLHPGCGWMTLDSTTRSGSPISF